MLLPSLLLILQIQFNCCLSQSFMNKNQTIREGDHLISKGNKFALGFFSPGNSGYRYLGIWYHKLPQKTVVWVANRNHPINDSSGILSFDQYGNLVLYSNSDPKVSVWSTNVSMEATDVCVAQLLDSGNLVLVIDRSKRIVWQSFDYPTHVQLPGMKLGLDRKTGANRVLTSWRSADDPGIGYYSFKVNPSGSPQFFLYNGTNLSWRTAPWPWRSQTNLYIKRFVNDQHHIYCFYTVPDDSVILSLMVDHSGFFKMVTWQESEGLWKELWKAPSHQCHLYGRCGAYSTCEPTVDEFECACLPGYEPKNPRDWLLRDGSGGCSRKRLESLSECGHGEGFVKVENVLLPDTSAAVWVDMSMSRADCEQECKRNCSCSAYASIDIPDIGSGCLTWYGELIDTIPYHTNDRYDLHVRVDAFELAENARKSNGSLKKKMFSILLLAVPSALLVIGLFAYLGLRRKGNKGTWVANELGGSSNNMDFEIFKLRTVCAATKNFSPANKLGQGGFGSVYKGHLPNGQEIAVKRLSKNAGEGIEEFKNEVMVIAKLQHRNLVKLVGCCIQAAEQMLIYEYLPNKSLDLFLFDEKVNLFLDWSKRFDIIVGIARGILYLHQDSGLRIIHRDLKCSNILLDSEMNPKISDFGLAKIFDSDQIQDKTNRVVGTYGYMSPEYALLGKFSVKSDIFSFGVMLLEIVSGKKNNTFTLQDPSRSLIGHIWRLWREDRALEIVDPSLQGLYHTQDALKCIQIGLLCAQEDSMDRPSMLAIVFMLNSTETALPSPKQPAFIF